MSIKGVALLLPVLGTIPSLAAQSRPASRPTLAVIEKQLATDDMAQIAWGAHLAGKHGMKPAVPALRKALDHLVEIKDHDLAAMAILDALLQLGVELPPAELEPWTRAYSHMLPAALVMMSRNPKKYDEQLVDLLDIPEANEWNSRYFVAAGNLLAAARSRKAAFRFLEGLEVTVSFNVYSDPKHMNSSFYGGPNITVGGRKRRATLRVPKNYPPVPCYRVWKVPLVHVVNKKPVREPLLAAGKRPVCYQRVVARSYGPRTNYHGEVTSSRQVEWLCAMLDIPAETQPLRMDHVVKVLWQDATAYERKVEATRTEVRGAFQGLVQRLQGKGLIVKDQVAQLAAPDIVFKVFDWRPKDAPPMPELEGVKVSWVKR